MSRIRGGSTIEQAIARADYLRRSPARIGGLGGHKEWMHFCVHVDGIDLLVNFSLVDDLGGQLPLGTEHARLTVLVREPDGRWDGAVERFDPREVTVVGGAIDMRFGPNELRWDHGAYRIRVRMRERAVAMDLVLEPSVMPALSNNIHLDPGTPLNWLVLPRLQAAGEVVLGDRRVRFTAAPAYHDHNWGHFAWGRDFAWEWCYALPLRSEVPWSLVFVRLDDRARTRTYMQGLFLWRGPRPIRVFRGRDVRVRQHGFLPPRPVMKIPRAMALIAPSWAADVPTRVEVAARAEGDELELEFESHDLAQVIIPNDTDAHGVTIINEVSGQLHARGRVRGEPVALSGPAIFEFVRD
jgi:hypothetical protein